MICKRVYDARIGLGLLLCLLSWRVGADIGSGTPGETNWYTHGGTHEESNYSALDQVNRRTISRLGLTWSLDLPGEVSLEATPLAIDGVLYFTGSSSDVYAVEARTGRVLWKYDPQIWNYRPESLKLLWGINRGVAYSNGKVFVGTHDGRLVALEARSGRVLWSTQTVAAQSLQTISGAPWVVNGKVLIGNGGADFAARGYVSAYDERNGQLLWRFYTVPGDPAKGYEADGFEREAMRMAARTWGKQWWKVGGGGGTVWDNMTYDPELNLIYIGVGNAGPYNPRLRSPGGGDNLFIASILALDADTGRYVWHYQENPGDSWDYKSTANMITAELTIRERRYKVLLHSPTNGFFYVIDRTNGRVISAEKTGKVTWADHIDLASGRPVETPGIRYENGPLEIWPSSYGTHNWQAMSYDVQTGLVYIPYMQLGIRIGNDQPPWPNTMEPPTRFGGVQFGFVSDSSEYAALLAWDPVAQRARWRVPYESFWNGGTLSTGGGLVFQGTGDGEFLAYDAANGQQLWAFDAKLGIIASPITYTAGSRQYVSVLVGYGGATTLISTISNRGWKFGAQPRRLLTFALDAHEKLPPTQPRDCRLYALDDPKFIISPARAAAGLQVYQASCANCHGTLLVSAGSPAPDLRESRIAADWESFESVVKQGTLLPKLMPRFSELSSEQLQDLFTYIRDGARSALTKSSQTEPAHGSQPRVCRGGGPHG
jgi:quinohemoprotein ethanol dehydrogenase